MSNYYYVVVRVHRATGKATEAYEASTLAEARSVIRDETTEMGMLANEYEYQIVIYNVDTDDYVRTLYNE